MEHFSRFPRMWRAMFKRECVYLLFQATSITGRRLPSPLPPPALSPTLQGGSVCRPGLSKGPGRVPTAQPASRSVNCGRNKSPNCTAQKQKSARWQWGPVSALSQGRPLLLEEDSWVPTQAQGTLEKGSGGGSPRGAPGGPWPTLLGGEDNEVLPLPHKAAIAVSFQKAPLVTKEPFRLPSAATLCAGAGEPARGCCVCLFVGWKFCFDSHSYKKKQITWLRGTHLPGLAPALQDAGPPARRGLEARSQREGQGRCFPLAPPRMAQGIPSEGLGFGSFLRQMLAVYNLTNVAPEMNPWAVIRKAVGGLVAGGRGQPGLGVGAGGGSCVGGRIH